MRSFPPEELYYITHINNLQSILEKGILSHERIEQLELKYTSIYDEEVVNIRKDKLTPDGESLWHFANLYFQPRNSMLFRIIHDSKIREASLVVIGVSKKVLIEHDILITDGNAANYPTQFYSYAEGFKMLKYQWPIIQRDSWNEGIGTKRKMMAECLVPNQVKPTLFRSLYVVNSAAEHYIKQIFSTHPILVVPEPNMFFN